MSKYDISNKWFYRPYGEVISKNDVVMISNQISLNLANINTIHNGIYYCYGSYKDNKLHHFIAKRYVKIIPKGKNYTRGLLCTQ